MLVSCIMPTRSRPEYAQFALDCWMQQTYENRELVILDDRDCPSFPHGLSLDGVRYYGIDQRLQVGAKRNICCSRSAGEVICHWDSDDASAPDRIAAQLLMLLESGKSVVGYDSMRFTDGSRWWQFRSNSGIPAGTSLMYLRSWWMEHPFENVKSGEDGTFGMDAKRAGQLVVGDAGNMMYATCHADNTSPRELWTPGWTEIAA